jgi:hypothetical protein
LSALAVTALVTAVAGVAVPSVGGRAAAADGQDVVLKVGDRVTVDGQPIGCRVADVEGKVVLDCRRGGPLAGTYGTMLGSRRATVVRFRSNQVAKVVFVATHHGGAHTCR